MALFDKMLAKYPPQNAVQKARVGATLGRLKGVHELLADAVESAEKVGILEALKEVSPWAEAVGSALGEALPPVKFALKLFEQLGKVDDPGDLGYLAATWAYQRAVEQALPEALPKGVGKVEIDKGVLRKLREAAPPEKYDFSRFSFETALQHPFVQDADGFLKLSADALGLGEDGFRRLQHEVHQRFVPNLKGILSHGKSRERFAPFRDLITLDTSEALAQDALLEHADYQRWLFEEKPVLGREPFTLSQVYVETDCGLLRWKDIQGGRDDRSQMDPFLEKNGGRQSLVEAVLNLLADESFKDAIVIQGVAGSGKSSMTLRLAWELVRQGLRPIRIELKHLDTQTSISAEEALPKAVHITEMERSPEAIELVFGKGLFLENSIFKVPVRFRGTRICPYVLILDGWDEISVGASEGYRQQLERMLLGVRRLFLEQQAFPVRVIVTGRPTEAVEESKFLRDDTRILTVRNFSPEQLESHFTKVQAATTAASKKGEESWSLEEVKVLPEILKRFRKQYEGQGKAVSRQEWVGGTSGSLEILGLPLLCHLALRLLAERPEDAEAILEDTTSLYRSLVDLVIGQGGKPAEAEFDTEASAMLRGEGLRYLLRGTAEAMTHTGAEAISHKELEARLGLNEEELSQKVDRFTGEQVLSRLMISFFFRGGRRELGAEFSHKSFREYLFAEQIVEGLKVYGRAASGDLMERDLALYWKDFEIGDERRKLCHRLAHLLGPVWLTPEVSQHIRRLLAWDIQRAKGNESGGGQPTESLSLEGWEKVRDGLAQAWEWWGEGVHLRPEPVSKPGRRFYEYTKPLVLVVAEGVPFCSDSSVRPVPPRTTTIDAHLGEGLFLVTAVVHALLGEAGGLTLTATGAAFGSKDAPLRYQRRWAQRGESFIRFAPSGPKSMYFFNYCARINAGGYRPLGPFPAGADLRGADLYRVYLRSVNLFGADLSWANLHGADLFGAQLSGAVLIGADFSGADFLRANLSGADLSRADLSGTGLFRADLTGATLSNADLRWTDLSLVDGLKQNQVNVARGGEGTKLPAGLEKPAHWGPSQE